MGNIEQLIDPEVLITFLNKLYPIGRFLIDFQCIRLKFEEKGMRLLLIDIFFNESVNEKPKMVLTIVTLIFKRWHKIECLISAEVFSNFF